MPEEPKKPHKIEDVKPPNPFDFSSICEFLEQVLAFGDMAKEYSRMVNIIAQKSGETKAADGTKEAVHMMVLDDDQFENEITKAFMIISAALVKYKQLSPKEQDIKREFLAKSPDSSLRAALTSAGFPELFGKTVIGKRFDELKPFKLTKALNKANGVFERAFYFTLKENELTKKSIEELMTSVRTMDKADDLKPYLEALLYKVEIASTEKSFTNLKKMVAEPLSEIRAAAEKEFLDLGEGRYPPGKGPYPKAKMEEELARMRDRFGILNDYANQYFCSDDFIYVEKNLLQFKKAKEEQQDRSNKPILSTDFTSTIERKLIIQIITAFKKCYNIKELWLLKAFLLKDLVGKEGSVDEKGEPTNKYHIKKNLILDALKRIRNDMIVEDTFTTATENKKLFMENFEKELLQLMPKQLQGQVLPRAVKESDEILSRAKRAVAKKADDGLKAEEDAKQFQEQIDRIGCDAVGALIGLHFFNVGRMKGTDFQAYLPQIEPQIRYIEQMVKRIEGAAEKEAKKKLVAEYLAAFQRQALATSSLAKDSSRMFHVYLKGLVDRVKYW